LLYIPVLYRKQLLWSPVKLIIPQYSCRCWFTHNEDDGRCYVLICKILMKESHWITLVIEWKDRQSRVDIVAVIEMTICIYWSESYPWIYFYIVLKILTGPNTVLLVLNRRTCAHREDWFRVICQSFFDLRLLITLLVSSNFSCKTSLERQ